MAQQMTATPTAPRRLMAEDLERVAPLIDGKVLPSASADQLETYDPSNGARLAAIPRGAAEDADRAVRAARASFDRRDWSKAPPGERKAVLLRWAELIAQNAVRLDALDALEMGKPVSLQVYNAMVAAGLVRFNAEAIDKVSGDVLSSDSLSTVIQTRGPRGVVAAIIPWNFPTYNSVLKIAPALAAGNSVVLKPSEFASQSAMMLGRLAHEAGLPPGVLNIVPGSGGTVGRALAEHMNVDMVTFTGSSDVGKLIMQYAGASNMKVVGAECGGKSPQIVFDDGIDPDVIAGYIARSIATNQGQVCSFGSRLLVQESLCDILVERISARLADIVAGDPQLSSTTYGPLVSSRQMQRVEKFLSQARTQGAEVVYGGRRILKETGGFFIEPTIVTNAGADSQIAREEIFGPVVAVLPFSDAEDAIRLANETSYGLAAYIWSTHAATGFRVANALQTAVTVVNADAVGSAGPGFAFSGEPAGLSGIGLEGGVAGLETYQRRQTMWFNHG
ncbi:hypothetical protein CAF53_03850 [Sphingobium sp. LB126]|nr:hypothetical protein CAF53_03850 [Sphingobium sp. LB126]